jgi:hypothetical protein
MCRSQQNLALLITDVFLFCKDAGAIVHFHWVEKLTEEMFSMCSFLFWVKAATFYDKGFQVFKSS